MTGLAPARRPAIEGRANQPAGRAFISGRPTRLRPFISVAEKAQMIKIGFVEN